MVLRTRWGVGYNRAPATRTCRLLFAAPLLRQPASAAGARASTETDYVRDESSQLEKALDSFRLSERREALRRLLDAVGRGEMAAPEAGDAANLHCHTFFSYNAYGCSPTKFAWLAGKAGLAAAGKIIVYPSGKGLGLVPPEEMAGRPPEVARHPSRGLWTAEAEPLKAYGG